MKKLFGLLIVLLALIAADTAQATIRYVIPSAGGTGCSNGSTDYDATANTCGGGSSTVYIGNSGADTGVAASSAPGDILDFRTGSYVSSGGSQGRFEPSNSGTASLPIIFRCHAGETCTIRGFGVSNGVNVDRITVDGFIMDGASSIDQPVYFGNETHFWRIINNEVKNGTYFGFLSGYQGTGSDHLIQNNDIHNNGLISDPGHLGSYGLYIGGQRLTVKGNRIYSNGGYGVHYLCSECVDTANDDGVVEGNDIYDNGGAESTQFGLLISVGHRMRAINNKVSGNTGGIQVLVCSDCVVYNNTVYNNNKGSNATSGMQVLSAGGTIIKNNIFYQNPSDLEDYGTGTVYLNNHCTNAGPGCLTTGDPQLVNLGTRDFHLQSLNSPPVNRGATLSIVTADFDGRSRPQGVAYDIGAFEFAQTSVTPGILQLSSPTYTVGEGGVTATITVTRTGGSSGIVGATVSTSNGTATAGVDYTTTSSAVSFGAGSTTSQTVSIPITDDATVESNETINITLSAPTGGATLGSPTSAVLTIIDNDVPVVSGVVGLWTFNEASGTATDTSGQSNTVTLVNGATRAAGVAGNALSLDGVDDYATAADSSTLDINSTFTILAWFSPSATMTDFKAGVVKNYTYYLYPGSPTSFCGGPFGGYHNGSVDVTACSTIPIPASPAWTLLSIVNDGATLRLSQNGVQIATAPISGPVPVSSGTLQIGASEWGEYFGGKIDDTRIYNMALTQAEILAIYNSVGVGSLAAPSNLIVK